MNKFTRWQRMTVFKGLLQAFDDPEGGEGNKGGSDDGGQKSGKSTDNGAKDGKSKDGGADGKGADERSILMLTLTRSSIRSLPSGRRIRKKLCLKPRNWHP